MDRGKDGRVKGSLGRSDGRGPQDGHQVMKDKVGGGGGGKEDGQPGEKVDRQNRHRLYIVIRCGIPCWG